MPALSNLTLDRIICHEVLLSSDLDRNRQPQYSEQQLELPSTDKELLSKRLIDALGSDSHSIEVDVEADGEGTTFDHLTRLLGSSDKDFVTLSKDLALKLTMVQTSGGIKAGILMIMDGRIGSKTRPNRFVSVLKAESDSGFMKEKTKHGLTLKYISDMVLGAQQRLNKIGLFVEVKLPAASKIGLRTKTDFETTVYDHQMSKTGGNQAARYFYAGFLGCKLAENSSHLTRTFYEQTSDHIDKSSKLSIEQRVTLKNHLVSYLRSEEPQISVKIFADRYLPEELHEPYFRRLKLAKFPLLNVIKDTSHINHKLRVRRMVFSNKVRISAPHDSFSENVAVDSKSVDGWTTVRIRGELESQK